MMYSKITWKTSWVLRSVPPYRKITPNTKQDNFLLPSAFDFFIHGYLNNDHCVFMLLGTFNEGNNISDY